MPTEDGTIIGSRLLLKGAFCDDISARILNTHTIPIVGVHAPPGGYIGAVRRYDDIPRG